MPGETALHAHGAAARPWQPRAAELLATAASSWTCTLLGSALTVGLRLCRRGRNALQPSCSAVLVVLGTRTGSSTACWLEPMLRRDGEGGRARRGEERRGRRRRR